MRRALAIGWLAVTVAGCAASSSSRSPSPAKPSTAPSGPVALGQPVTVNVSDGTVTLTLISLRYRSGSPNGVAPVHGRFAVADVKVSVRSGSYDYNPEWFRFQSDDAREYGFLDGHGTEAGYGPALSSGTLSAGQSARGFVTFDVPGRGRDVQVTDPLGKVLAQWRL